MPKIEHWQSAGGAAVYFIHAPELPMIDLQIAFAAGSSRDAEQWGLANFVASMMNEGAGGLDADAIAAGFDRIGANYSGSASRDMAMLSLRCLTNEPILKAASALFATLLTEVNFPEDALERVRQQIMVSLTAEEQSPASIASKAFFSTLYGDHPYAHTTSGEKQIVSDLTAKDLQKFYQQYYVQRNATVAVVGALSRPQVEALVESVMGKLPQGEAAPTLPAVAAVSESVQKVIDYPSSQTHLLMGQPGYAHGDVDRFALYLGNHILGGSGLTSRIIEEIREKRGLSYSAYSYFSPMQLQGPFMLGLQTKNAKRDEALSVLNATLKRFIEEGPTAEEVQRAKNNITGGFPLSIDSNSDLLGFLLTIGFYQLPLDYIDTFTQNIEAVTAEAIREAFRRRIHPQQMVTVMVGSGG
ncbi:MAG: insulinase family protein [Gammaproteobacteria bacterium]|nr:insulinase family protein [Gammaproteobacteria bacterium]